jgi:hypothetical protein
MRTYVVRQGDYLKALAFKFGFRADEVWGHETNKKLRERRPDPQSLQPGDILHIPEPRPPTLSMTAGQTNRYRAEVPTTRIRVRLCDSADAPIANAPYRLSGADLVAPEGVTDAHGMVDFEVSVRAREVRLLLVETGEELALMIGHMDPVTEESGIAKRLEHLGFGSPESSLAGAVRVFQATRNLPQTGVVDQETLDALTHAHGET